MMDSAQPPKVYIGETEYQPVAPEVVEPVVEETPTKSSWDFLKSPRFWKMGIVSASTVLLTPGLETRHWYELLGQFLAEWLGVSIVIGTYDRTVDKVTGN
jgi:hypothetical protein